MPRAGQFDRIVVGGTSGSGKSTLARALASALGSPYVEMDAIRWLPGWTMREPAEFEARLAAAAAAERWVIDGNIRSPQDPLWQRVTVVVWLDYPLWLVMGRLLRRTARRVARREALWAGNRESVWRALGPDSILLWALKTHGLRRRTYETLIAFPPVAGVEILRLRRAREAEELVERVRANRSAR